MTDRLNPFTVRECEAISAALTERACSLRREARACAKAAGNWEDPSVQRLEGEATFVAQLAKSFKLEEPPA